jgi:DNA polymerase-3 subunit delta
MTQNILIIAGSDEFSVHRRAKECFEEWSTAIPDPNSIEKLDGRYQTVDEVQTGLSQFNGAVRTRSMFGGEKLVWWHSLSFLDQGVLGRREGSKEAADLLVKTLEELSGDPVVRIIVSVSSIAKNHRLLNWAAKAKAVKVEAFFVDKRNPQKDLAALVKEEIKASGLKFANGVPEILLDRVGYEARMFSEEIKKLALYFADEPDVVVREQHIFDLVPPFGETEFFEAAEVFFSGNQDQIQRALRRHFFSHPQSARGLLAILQTRVPLFIQLNVLSKSGDIRGGKPELAGHPLQSRFFEGVQAKSPFNLFSQNAWYLSKFLPIAQRRSLKAWIDIQQHLLQAFIEIIERPNQQEEVMRELAFKCN